MKLDRIARRCVPCTILALAASCGPAERAEIAEPTREAIEKEPPKPAVITESEPTIGVETQSAPKRSHRWAGVYSGRPGRDASRTVQVNADGSYTEVFRLRKSTIDRGHVEFVDGQLIFHVEEAESTEPRRSAWIVPWGERRYMLSDSGIIAFANSVNSGLEDSGPTAFMCRDRDEPVSGRPEMPEQFRALILDSPIDLEATEVLIDTTITKSGKEKRSVLLELAGGTNRGVYVGLSLYATCPDGRRTCRDHFAVLEVVRCTETSCEVELILDYSCTFTRGMRFTTNHY